ncbi:hypothetical protein HYFRA_00004598 [Hymenoscyphus fraxineus]|uniref:Uncharacterized protein n=1 Tax=Hymenoscyphus fraxineus TaxID=746836 RepID=A0A9N9KX47_9HELO|nr:hypothetical protein HYFRA_00004598 [Hymenoscyphus fraxineus]
MTTEFAPGGRGAPVVMRAGTASVAVTSSERTDPTKFPSTFAEATSGDEVCSFMRLMASSTDTIGYGDERFLRVGPRLGSFDNGHSEGTV